MAPNTASLLPLLPRIFFVYIEPILISGGISMQLSPTNTLPAGASIVQTAQAGISSSYLLSMMLYGLIILLATPPNKTLLKLHIGVLILADFAHWAALFSTMAAADSRGWAGVLDTKSWDQEIWGLVFAPFATFLIKVGTLAGVFGRIKG
ncbi:hypothetical protein GGS20DRAFT_543972 [Poronia punctata]|nr:hypothetical protein GGS20DRAFT_543972 [Poronia punctata]